MRRLVAERRIPIVKVGRLVRFDGHDVEHWVDDHRVELSCRRPSPSGRHAWNADSSRRTVVPGEQFRMEAV